MQILENLVEKLSDAFTKLCKTKGTKTGVKLEALVSHFQWVGTLKDCVPVVRVSWK